MASINEKDKIISGRDLSAIEKERIKEKVKELNSKGIEPKIAMIVVGNDLASRSYVRGKNKDCAQCGIESVNITLPESTSQEELMNEIDKLNNDNTVHGILVQLPLPKHIDEYAVTNKIATQKDVDGFTAVNVGNLVIGKDCFYPCTPQGCIDLIKYAGVDLKGKDVVVIGRSNIVGKPLRALLTKYDATVTLCHSKTKNLSEKTKSADIVIVAIGKRGFLTGDMLKNGAVVIDVGINRNTDGKICGDADFESCIRVASKITPVPGGVGLMTRVNLLKNTVKSAENMLKNS
jgi:methylenetetrahydrofolate dehydrogenase (NADP+)/methenyltetrahydrofolate cyclohydrolase